jgi:flagellar basal body-associated protein FliL
MNKKRKALLIIGYFALPMMLAWVGHLVFNMQSDNFAELHGFGHSTIFYNLPVVSVGMDAGDSDRRTGTMKLSLSIEVRRQDVSRLPDFLPRIMERIVFYVHRQNFSDLREPGGEKLLREGLESEINHGALPIHVASVAIERLVFE